MSGLCGVVSSQNCSQKLFFGTDYHAHLGSQLAGMAVFGTTFRKKIHNISQSQFKSKFGETYQEMDGNMGIGVISDSDAQPLLVHSRFGTYAVASAGLVENKPEVTKTLFKRGSVFTETSNQSINSVEILAKIIDKGENLVDGICQIYKVIEGSATLLILTEDCIYAARDKLGRTPLIIGENEGDFMVASESSAFVNLGFKVIKELGPGEIVKLNTDGYKIIKKPQEEMKICSFLWIYTGYPASTYENICVEKVRERSGCALAKRDNIKADLVTGVPDSGVGHGIGYSIESKIPYRRVLVKYTPGYGRSYIPPNQAIRDQVAKMKLIPVPEVIKDNKIILCEDSIVRGTQLKNYTIQKLREAGAKAVHLRAACPPLMFPCKYALSTRTVEELVARKAIRSMEGDHDENLDEYLDQDSDRYKKMINWIEEYLNVDSIHYQRIEDMIEAIGLPEEKLCLYCWNGKECGYRNGSKEDVKL